jgi:Ca-activated chloride channel homolog
MRVFGVGIATVLCLGGMTAFVVGPRGHTDEPGGPSVVSPPSERAGVVAGSVVDGQGAALQNVTVELLAAGVVVRTGKTNARGEFTFADVAPGTYEVRATRPGLVPSSLRVAVSALPTPRLVLSIGVPMPGRPADAVTYPMAQSPAAPGASPRMMAESARSAQSVPVAPPPAGVAGMAPGPYTPQPEFKTEAYDRIDDNRFRRSSNEPLSTFSIDVDTASYTNVRRYLNDGALPPADAVRIEELVNYFRFDYPDSRADAPFSVTTEVSACPWNPRHKLALIGLQARRDARKTPPRNLVFLLDVSGSMMPPDKLPLVKSAMRMLVNSLTAQDRVAIVVYAGASGLALPSTAGDRKEVINRAISALDAGGSTNGADGIQLAYNTAASTFVPEGVNRVILATDGDFNVGVTSQGELVRLIERERERGIFLSVLGVGTGNLKDATMEKLADKGNGNYAYLDSLNEARRVLIQEAGATFVTVAKDVKLQVEFNPRTVAAYRLVGYENRLLNREDFNDDKKDAGEIGAGHTVTALYEIVPAGENVDGGTVDPLLYQDTSRPTAAATSGDLMTVKVRYKRPDSERSQLLSVAVRDREAALTANLGFAAAVAQFGMLLRNSEFKGNATWSSAQTLARQYRGEDPDGYRGEFIRLVDLAAALDTKNNPRHTTDARPHR